MQPTVYAGHLILFTLPCGHQDLGNWHKMLILWLLLLLLLKKQTNHVMAAFRGTYPRSYPEETAQRTRQPRNPGMEINPAGERGSLWWMNWNTSCIITKCWKAPCYCCVRDGELIIKVTSDNTPKHALRPGFLSTFALATDQGSKLGLSKNKSIICYYNTYQVSS